MASLQLILIMACSPRVPCAPPRLEPETVLPVLDVNAAAFPASSLVDFAPTLDAPAGKHGFLFAGTDGHFYFEDGRRGRFWGINVAKDAVFVPKEAIDQAADCLASAGFSLVRLHHVDGATGLLPPGRAGTAERLDPDKLDLLFYWVGALKKRGIYVYLDLLDFREFQAAEGVEEAGKLDRAAKPASVFNDRLIELQIQYARDLLFGKVNPYTGLALGADPAVALVELCDENGLFRGSRWAELPAPYLSELARRWSFWLLATYGSTDRVREAWSGADGRSAMAATERLEDHSVRLLPPREEAEGFPSPTGQAEAGGGRGVRDRDVARFFCATHCEYFAQMREALRNAGLQVPITAVTEWENPADLRSVADTLDFIGCNWYYDHPVFAAGKEWRVPSFYTNADPIGDDAGLDFTTSVLRASAADRPLVVREWGVCWPSKFRGAGLMEATAYAALQDIDALIMFTYNADPENRRIEYFDVSSDPARWGLSAAAGLLYRTRAVSPAARKAAVALPKPEVFTCRPATPPLLGRLGWVSQLRQAFVEGPCDSSGRDLLIGQLSPSVTYPGPRVMLPDVAGPEAAALLAASGYPIAVQPAPRSRFVFGGLSYDPGQAVTLPLGPRFTVAELRGAGLEPLGVSDDGAVSVGFWDPRRQCAALTPSGEASILRTALDLLAGSPAGGAPPAHAAVEAQTYTSDTGQVTRRLRDEAVAIDSPTFQVIAGALSREATRTSCLSFSSASPIGVIVAASLDGKPVAGSDALLVKMVTVASNAGEKKGTRDAPPGSPNLRLDDFGAAPVDTHGQPADQPTSIDLEGQPLLRAHLANGTWEALRKGHEWALWCDTPNTRFALPGLGANVQVVPFTPKGAGAAVRSPQPFVYPKACLFVRVLPA
jgi:hypothetical protein